MPVQPAAIIVWGTLAAIGAAIFFGSPLAWGFIVRRLTSGEEIVPFEPRRAAPWISQFVVIVAACLAIGAFASLFSRFTRPPENDNIVAKMEPPAADAEDAAPADQDPADADKIAAQFLGGAAVELVVIGVLLVLLRWSAGATARDFGFDFRRAGYDIGLGLTAFLAMSVPTYGLMMVMTQLVEEASHPVTDAIAKNSSLSVVLSTILLAVIVAPIVEELLFRVLLQGWLEAIVARRSMRVSAVASAAGRIAADEVARGAEHVDNETPMRDEAPIDNSDTVPTVAASVAEPPAAELLLTTSPGMTPILISSLLFALAHISYGPSAIPLFFFAIALGYLYQQTHRLLPSLVLHMSLNGLTMLAVVAELSRKF